jgi:hypothetical protein
LVAPRVFTAIEDAKVSALIQDVQRLKTVVTQYYKDTGLMPQQEPGGVTTNRTLISNGAVVAGWKGPYIEEEISSPFETSTIFKVWSGSGQPFDVDGDGTDDFTGNVTAIEVNGLTFEQAKAISHAIDQDGEKTGTAAWYDGGKVRTQNATAPSATALGDLIILLAPY